MLSGRVGLRLVGSLVVVRGVRQFGMVSWRLGLGFVVLSSLPRMRRMYMSDI